MANPKSQEAPILCESGAQGEGARGEANEEAHKTKGAELLPRPFDIHSTFR